MNPTHGGSALSFSYSHGQALLSHSNHDSNTLISKQPTAAVSSSAKAGKSFLFSSAMMTT
eukprot:CAMPEP_0172601004 /NCGR_PEP_ID=MMETSP1068-20121228/21156_1 /TAXON_ID=35684 /ORGANISM="Pseudopedinella elastica, Strain CCMP716" /LENGTH=59 /DNA_ID=CAMNT_0013401843 /DNA_START=114 /DNA_END=290 /DNA_ORIENTATION=+